jgi:hypothetical protein
MADRGWKERAFAILHPLFSILVFLSLAGCASVHHADFVISQKPVGPPIVGFGVCMNPYLYAFPNTPDEISPSQLANLEAKVKRLHPQFVRIFFLNSWWEQDTDQSIAKNHPGMRESVIRTIRLAQEAGASVLLQLWYDPDRYNNPDDVAGRFANAIAQLRQEHGLTAIRFATIQNEPDEHEADDGSSMDRYALVYRAFDKALRDRGLHGEVQIVGGDLVSEHWERWLKFLGRDLSPVLDGYSIHSYWDYWDITKMVRHVRDVAEVVQKMPRQQRRPVFVTEFGAQGFRENPRTEPGKSDDGKPLADVPVYSFEMAIFLLECINAGFVGTAQWDGYDIWYDRKMGYGLIGSVQNGFPLKPGYHLLQLFTRASAPGWRAMKIEGQIEDVWVAALAGQSDELSLFVLNRLHGDKTVTLAGLQPGRLLQVCFWNADGTGQPLRARSVSADENGRITVTVPHYAIAVLSTNVLP